MLNLKDAFAHFDKEWKRTLRECEGDKLDAAGYLTEIVNDTIEEKGWEREDVEMAMHAWRKDKHV